MELWRELGSTHGYPAAMRAEALARSRDVTVRRKPFLLGPRFAEQGWNDSPFNVRRREGTMHGARSRAHPSEARAPAAGALARARDRRAPFRVAAEAWRQRRGGRGVAAEAWRQRRGGRGVAAKRFWANDRLEDARERAATHAPGA
jgi:hypothetical protein